MSYTGQTVLVMLSEDKVVIRDPNTLEQIAEHERFYNDSGNKSHYLPEHLTEKEKLFLSSEDYWVEKLTQVGYTRDLSEAVIQERFEYQRGYVPKFVSQLQEFVKTYGVDIAQRSLSFAYATRALNMKCIEQAAAFYSKQCELDFGGEQSDYNSQWKTPNHENIRNNFGQ